MKTIAATLSRLLVAPFFVIATLALVLASVLWFLCAVAWVSITELIFPELNRYAFRSFEGGKAPVEEKTEELLDHGQVIDSEVDMTGYYPHELN